MLIETQAKQVLILAARADYLTTQWERKRISEIEYFSQLNGLRRECGLSPLEVRARKPRAVKSANWATAAQVD